MKKNLETFIPALLKTIQRNGGILDVWETERIYSPALVALALKKEIVGSKRIILNANDPTPIRIECITHEWDGRRPAWLERYKENKDGH